MGAVSSLLGKQQRGAAVRIAGAVGLCQQHESFLPSATPDTHASIVNYPAAAHDTATALCGRPGMKGVPVEPQPDAAKRVAPLEVSALKEPRTKDHDEGRT